jgi:hypothetical protein
MPEQNKPKSSDSKGIFVNNWKKGKLSEKCDETMKGPHPKPGEVQLNRIRESVEKRDQFKKDLLAAGRTEEEAMWESFSLVRAHMERLAKEDPYNYARTGKEQSLCVKPL